MLVFGHTGITLGAAALLSSALGSGRFSKETENKARNPSSYSSQVVQTPNDFPSHKAAWFTLLVSYVDIRFLLVGSLLPDFIDKPIGILFLRETFSNGRIFCHTLLFLILVTVAGLYFYRRHNKTWLLTFSFGTLTHLIFDQMWRIPQTLLWPLLGLAFERVDISNWIPNIFYALTTDPAVYIPELVGAVILIWFVLVLVRRRQFCAFIKNGQFV